MHISRLFFKISDIVNHPLRNYKRYKSIKVIRDISFDDAFKENKLDIYHPTNFSGKMPVILNVHGGGFVRGDKKLRSGIARFFASKGWFVVNINYRLAPKYTFPAATIDTLKALEYLTELEKSYDIDLSRLVLTGDSAGGYYASHAAAAATNPELCEMIKFPQYNGPKVTALLSFCSPFNLEQCFTAPVPFKITIDVTNCVFGTSYKDYGIDKSFEFYDTLNVVDFVTKNFPVTFLVEAKHDSFCGNQALKMKERLDELNIQNYIYIAEEKGDGHCTHLLPFKKGTNKALFAVSEFLNKINNISS